MPAKNNREKQNVDDKTHPSDGETPSRQTREVRRRWSGDS